MNLLADGAASEQADERQARDSSALDGGGQGMNESTARLQARMSR